MNLPSVLSIVNDSDRIIDFDDIAAKRKFMMWAGTLSGLHDVRIKPRKLTRSLDQNAYWWVAVVTPFRDWLRDQYGDSSISLEQAHEMLKVKVLGLVKKELPNGEMLELIPESRSLKTDEFTLLIEGAAKWLAEFTGIVVISSDLFFAEKGKAHGRAK